MNTQKKFVIATSKSYYRTLEQLPGCLSIIDNKEDLTYSKLLELKPDYIFFPHWSYIIPKEIYENFQAVIFHMTDVPYGRGGSPLQNLIVRGHTETKITALKCVKELDAGPVFLKKKLTLEGSAESIFLRANDIIKTMIEEIIQSDISPLPQEGEIVPFQRRKPEQSNVAELAEIEEIYDYIRMLDAEGYPHAFIDNKAGIKFELRNVKKNLDNSLSAEVKIIKYV